MTEIEHRPLAPIPRVAKTHGRLERGATADELGLGQLPQLLTCEQASLHDLRQAVPAFCRRQRREQPGIDDGAGRPVKRAD